MLSLRRTEHSLYNPHLRIGGSRGFINHASDNPRGVFTSVAKITIKNQSMLSCKTTYAIQILDLLWQSEKGMSLTDIRTHFISLPNKLLLTGIVRRLKSGRLVRNASSRGGVYRLACDLNDITLDDLTRVVDDALVLGTPVDFLYWQEDFLKAYPRIARVEESMQEKIAHMMKSVTIGKLLDREPRRHGEHTVENNRETMKQYKQYNVYMILKHHY